MFNHDSNLFMKRIEIETAEKWRMQTLEMPYLKFKPDWEVKIIPPFCGATVRFVVKKPHSEKDVSVYLDMFSNLGFFGSPYWEIYPTADGETWRCALGCEDELIAEIDKALNNDE
jgi:hypothetical protein